MFKKKQLMIKIKKIYYKTVKVEINY